MKTILNRKMIGQIEAYAERGLPQRYIANILGFGEDRIIEWRKKGKKALQKSAEDRNESEQLYVEFAQSLLKGRAAAVTTALEKIETAEQWQSSAWLLERLDPQSFGRKVVFDPETVEKYYRTHYGEEGWQLVKGLLEYLDTQQDNQYEGEDEQFNTNPTPDYTKSQPESKDTSKEERSEI